MPARAPPMWGALKQLGSAAKDAAVAALREDDDGEEGEREEVEVPLSSLWYLPTS